MLTHMVAQQFVINFSIKLKFVFLKKEYLVYTVHCFQWQFPQDKHMQLTDLVENLLQHIFDQTDRGC